MNDNNLENFLEITDAEELNDAALSVVVGGDTSAPPIVGGGIFGQGNNLISNIFNSASLIGKDIIGASE